MPGSGITDGLVLLLDDIECSYLKNGELEPF